MKKITLLLLVIPFFMNAQKKEEIFRKLGNTSCECANKSQDVSTTSLGLCILSSLNLLTDKERKIIGYTGDDKMAALEKISESMGMEMASICPELFTKLESSKVTDTAATEEEEEATYEVGTFDSIVANEFNTMFLVNEKNEKTAFIWLFTFDGDSLLIKNKIAKGDKLEVYYREQEFFDPKTNSYKKYNEITSVKLL